VIAYKIDSHDAFLGNGNVSHSPTAVNILYFRACLKAKICLSSSGTFIAAQFHGFLKLFRGDHINFLSKSILVSAALS